MNTAIRNFALFAALLSMSALAPACSCGDDDDDGNNNPDASDVDAPGVDADPNAFPVLGTQIDRAGRAAITSALIKAIDFVDAADQAALRDQYNADDDPSSWAADYGAEIGTHLGILDSLNADDDQGNGCGDQIAFDDVNNNYAPLSGVLAADRLLINTTLDTCVSYLALEAGSTTDCGGRTPIMDAVDVSYTVLINGGAAAIGDGVLPTATANTTAFPFLGEPLPPN